jgi:hypothetical protein
MNFSELLENISDDFIRVDNDLLVRISELNLSDKIYTAIEESLRSAIGEKGYMPAKTFDAFFFFPDIGRSWNPFLLVSLVKRYGKSVNVMKDIIDYRYLTEILVCSNLGVQDYDDLLRYAIGYENKANPFTTIAQIDEFLKDQYLISSGIPKRLLDEGMVYESQNKIVINWTQVALGKITP